MHIQEFNYSNTAQRRILLLSLFFSIVTLSSYAIMSTLFLTSIVLYQAVWKYILTLSLSGILTGIIIGTIIHKKITVNRMLLILLQIVISCLAIAPGIASYFDNGIETIYLAIAQKFSLLFYCLIFLLFTLEGIKSAYFLKTSIGDYIDNKNPALFAISVALFSIVFSFYLSLLLYSHMEYLWIYFLFPLLSLILIIFLNLPFCPPTIISRTAITKPDDISTRDDVLFTYSNISIISIFTTLILITIYSRQGIFIATTMYTISAIIGGFLIGMFLSTLLKKYNTVFIYGEMLYPLLFLTFIIISHTTSHSLYGSLLAAAPFSIFAGITFGTSLKHILIKNNHPARYTIILFSFFLIPLPIIIAFIWIELTYFWFFAVTYILSLITIVFPGLYLLQNFKRSVPSIIYFIVSLLFIPAIIITHIYFKLPLSDSLVNAYSRGYEDVVSSNFNSSFITKPGVAYINDYVACRITDATARDLKRSITFISLFADNHNTIIIDGYHKFFTNSLFHLLNSPIVLDYISDRIVDYQKPAISDVHFATIHTSIIQGLKQKKGLIVDIPNTFDHYMYPFRFSDAYIAIIKEHVDSYYFTIIDITNIAPNYLYGLTNALKKYFLHTVVFVSGNHLTIGATNNSNGFILGASDIQNLETLIQTTEVANLFVNAEHALSYMVSNTIELIMPRNGVFTTFALPITKPAQQLFINPFVEKVITTNDAVVQIIDNQYYYANTIGLRMLYAKPINQLIKQSEYYGLHQHYESEMQTLMQLRRIAEYTPHLRQYIINIISFKEKLYETIALDYEKQKQWDRAISLYNAMLAVNPNNFTANYRIGIINATIQNLENAFKYLNNAMRMDPNNPDVLYQLGILLVSQGKFNEALQYLTQAHQMNMASASLFFNIGLCYESLKNLEEAKRYYEKAKLIDPNDATIQSSLERVSEQKVQQSNQNADTRTNQIEEEKGESFPLPINQSAYDVRLKENELKDQDTSKIQQ